MTSQPSEDNSGRPSVPYPQSTVGGAGPIETKKQPRWDFQLEGRV